MTKHWAVKKEIYKPIKGYEGLYEISNFGNLKRLQKTVIINGSSRTYSERILSGTLDKNGFLKCVLVKGSISSSKRIHKLVAEAFLEDAYCGRNRHIKHIDEDKANNRLDNLKIIKD